MNRMLMAARTLAARIERAECETVLAYARQLRARGTDVMIRDIGGGAAVFAGPGQPINKLAGLGFSGQVDDAALAAIERDYDEREAELRVELATLADPSIGRLLTGRGYELAGYENVLGLPLDANVVDGLTLAREADVARRPGGAGGPGRDPSLDRNGGGRIQRARSIRRTAADRIVRARRDRRHVHDVERDGRRYALPRPADGEVAGGGASRICDRLVQLAGAATLPIHRRRGAQSALLRARLLDAARQGCDLAIVTTEPASKSQENVHRAGFALLLFPGRADSSAAFVAQGFSPAAAQA